MRFFPFVVPLILGGVLVLFLWLGLRADIDGFRSPDVLAPEFSLSTISLEDHPDRHDDQGKSAVSNHVGRQNLSHADLEGKVAVVNFFASWCLPCRAEHRHLMALAQEGVTIYGIAYKDESEAVRHWLVELGNPYTKVGMDTDGMAGVEWGLTGVPETFVIDRLGGISERLDGTISAKNVQQLRDILRSLSAS